jgi:transposase
MTNTIAAIDVHKKVLMVVTGVEAGDSHRFATTRDQLEQLAEWLHARGVEEVVMESTAQYWKPVWQALEPRFRLHLAQAHSNRAPRGRKHDFGDARRLLRRMLAGELILSFVPDQEQRSWRTATRMRQQLVRDRVRLQAQIEALLEEAAIKLSSVLSDLLSLSGRRILDAIAHGQTDPARLADLGDRRLRCGREQLEQALHGRVTPLHQQLLALFLQRLTLLDRHLEQLEELASQAMSAQRDAILRLAEVPGLGLESARQIVAEVGVTAATFPSPDRLASWTGICPGRAESAEVSRSAHSAKGNRHFRRILVQAAQAASRTKGSYLQTVFRRLLPRLGFAKALWALAHRLCRLVWKLLHDGVRYLEHGQIADPRTRKHLATKYLRALSQLGFQVQITHPAL